MSEAYHEADSHHILGLLCLEYERCRLQSAVPQVSDQRHGREMDALHLVMLTDPVAWHVQKCLQSSTYVINVKDLNNFADMFAVSSDE